MPGWVSNPDTALGTLILLNVWTFGSPMIIFLAGLRQIPQMYYEAASVDGASKVKQFFTITIPLLTPIIFFNVVLQIINSFQTFTQAFVVSGGTAGPPESTMFFTLYLYQKGFAQFDMGYASAMAWLLLTTVATFPAADFFAPPCLVVSHACAPPPPPRGPRRALRGLAPRHRHRQPPGPPRGATNPQARGQGASESGD